MVKLNLNLVDIGNVHQIEELTSMVNDLNLKGTKFLDSPDLVKFNSTSVNADNYLKLLSQYHLQGYCSEVHYGKDPKNCLVDFEQFANSLSVYLNNTNKVS